MKMSKNVVELMRRAEDKTGQQLGELVDSIKRLEGILNAPENMVTLPEKQFDYLVDTCCRFMQTFHEITGYSWGEYKEAIQ